MRGMTVAILGMVTGAAVAQAPPIKMGLWEGTMTMTSPLGKRTAVTQSCLTQESFEKALSMMQTPPQGCTVKNGKDAHEYTVDATCKLPQGIAMEMHGVVTVIDAEHTTTSVHSTTQMGSQTIVSDVQGTSHFVKSDCGSVTPDKPVVTQQ